MLQTRVEIDLQLQRCGGLEATRSRAKGGNEYRRLGSARAAVCRSRVLTAQVGTGAGCIAWVASGAGANPGFVGGGVPAASRRKRSPKSR